MKRVLLIAFSVAALLALTAAPAAAGPPGKWTRITGVGGIPASNTDEIGLERTGNGVLHVAWTRETASGNNQLLHSALSGNAQNVAGPHTIIALSDGLNNSVDLTANSGGGLRVLFAGLFPAAPIDRVLSSATAGPAGTTWTAPSPVSNTSPGGSSPVYAGAGIAGFLGGPGGDFVGAWGDSSPGAGGFHLGINPADPDTHFPNTCCSIDPGVGVDSQTGQFMVARNDSATDVSRIRVTRVGGSTVSAPNSGASSTQQRISISGRIGKPGVFVAYGKGTNQFLGRPAWWRVGAPKFHFFKSREGAENVGLAPAPGGRLWLFWEFEGHIEAVRTGTDAVSVGAIRKIKLPNGADDVSGIFGEGSKGPLDLLTLTDPASGMGYFHQRIKPGLRITTAVPNPVKRGKNIVFTVTDGDPVAGAVVRLVFGAKRHQGHNERRREGDAPYPRERGPRQAQDGCKETGLRPRRPLLQDHQVVADPAGWQAVAAQAPLV